MFILYAVAIGVVVGLLAGGRPSGLATIRIRWAPVIAGGLLFQVLLFAAPVAERIGDLGPALYLGSTVAVAVAVLRNWAIPGIPLVVAGAACNLAAVLSNGGFMPASAQALAASGKAIPAMYSNSSAVPDPVLWPLTDVFALPRWLPAANVFSVGDVLIGVGVAMVIVAGMRLRPTAEPIADPAAEPAPGEPGGAPAH
jgi:hypothetical protein